MTGANWPERSLDLEHQTLFTCLAEVLKSARPPAAFAEHLDWKRAVGAHLHRLTHLLTDHFRSEEAEGGLYDRLRAHHPGDEAELNELIAEHGLLARWVAGVWQGFHDGHVPAATLESELRGFLQALERHERREAGLVHRLEGGAREPTRPADVP